MRTNPEGAPYESLQETATSGDLEAVKALLDNGADINVVDSLGSLPLHAAAEQGHWDIARLFLEKGMSPWTQDANNSLPVHNAAKGGHLKTARLLLECDRAKGSYSNKRGETALHFAAESGNIELVQLLLSFNVLTTSSARGKTALHRAANNGHPKVCELLMQYDDAHKPRWRLRMIGVKAQVKMQDLCQHTPLVYAVKEGHVDLKGDDGKNALHLAADTRNLEIARLLLENGASTKIKDSIGYTPSECSRDKEVTMLIRNRADQAAALDPKGRKVLPPWKAAVAAPPEYVA
ncbi:hypothetical protein PENVUL_c082G09221 [Penicillium vulpinum]|uniref:Uncharacterized protein n=1 Tax=Penicillium vulpinum TaxID=29845 RepID=A0A1V6R8M8_9EURO|nr:hypothetical protein PENVUL_c082G09221 [Penicillium vulpinum]